MNLLDWALIGLVTVSVVTAAMQGLVYEIWMMAATLAAVVVAAWKYPAVESWLHWIPSEPGRSLAAFFLILVALMLLAMAVGRLVRGMLRAVGLGWMDRLLGAGLGLARGVVLGAVAVLLLTAYPLHEGWVARSELAPAFLRVGRTLAAMAPPGLTSRLEAQIRSHASGAVREFGPPWHISGKELP